MTKIILHGKIFNAMTKVFDDAVYRVNVDTINMYYRYSKDGIDRTIVVLNNDTLYHITETPEQIDTLIS